VSEHRLRRQLVSERRAAMSRRGLNYRHGPSQG
jgi:hypothetical protein